jgi:hypothetical protein
MSKAAVHTTVRELSLAISQREREARQLRRTARESTYHSDIKDWRRPTDAERKALERDAASLDSGLPELRAALAALSVVISKGYV